MSTEESGVVPDAPGTRSITIYPDLVSGIVFLLLGAALFVLLPGQVAVAQNDVVNGRVFPRLLIVLMLACSAYLIVKDGVRLARKQPVATKTIYLSVELRALAIFAVLLMSYALAALTDLFVIGACFCCVGFLVYFKCRKKSYYAITLAGAVLIWASFRFILNVNF